MSLTSDVYGDDIYTEPEPDPNTLANLGPLTSMAGVFAGEPGNDEHPESYGIGTDTYVERYDLQPIDPQTNGPQLFYGLRYHIHIVKPGEVETFHDQVGYWLWEPSANLVLLSLAIPRGQVVLAGGEAQPDATEFELSASLGSPTFGIASNPFLDRVFRTTSFRMHVDIHDIDSWSYDEDTVMELPGQAEPFHHTDENKLVRVGPPTPNPLAAV